MQNDLSSQIKACQTARKHFDELLKGCFDSNEKRKLTKISNQMNDCASTIAAIKMILSGDIGKEFEEFFYRGERLRKSAGDDFLEFLRQKGLNKDLIK